MQWFKLPFCGEIFIQLFYSFLETIRVIILLNSPIVVILLPCDRKSSRCMKNFFATCLLKSSSVTFVVLDNDKKHISDEINCFFRKQLAIVSLTPV